jgi:hypothetical protein
MKDSNNVIKRLLRPPSVVNWVRHNFRRLDDTQRGLLRFAQSPPKHSLAEAYVICEAIVTDRISLKQAEACVDRIKHPMTQKAAHEIVPAFFAYATENGLEGLSAFKGFRTPYPIGRAPDGSTMTIPVVPTFTLLEDGVLNPVFMIGWSSLSLNGYQKQLLSTIIRNAILTQQDFLNSDATVICTPRFSFAEARHLRVWSVREYATLTEAQLQQQFERYGSALADVIRTLSGE